MRTAQEIYDAYRIMPGLQLHQLRVAAVGKTVCESFSGELDARSVVLACLFHDMGNIIKSDFTILQEFLQPEGLLYWQQVKDDYVKTYGPDEHAAAFAIAKAIPLPDRVCALIDDTRFSKLEAARDSDSFESKVVKYSDLRAAPTAIVSMAERFEEGEARYAKKKGYDTPEGRERQRRSIAAAYDIERQIFERCSIEPGDLTEEALRPVAEELRNYPVA